VQTLEPVCGRRWLCGGWRRGWSWKDIAIALEVSKQAVHKKHASRVGARDLREV